MSSQIIHGDCLDVMARMPADSVDLIVTSPPYASRRKKQYGSKPAETYVEWFAKIAAAMQNVLKPDGSLVLNVKENVIGGQRAIWVIDTILMMRGSGWLWIEEYVWRKTTSYPGKWPTRFRDGWERCLHFTLGPKFKMYQDSVMVPTKNEKDQRRASGASDRRHTNETGSGFGRNRHKWADRTMVYPDNVLDINPVNINSGHPAAFPTDLPDFFIRLFTNDDDVVLDPFVGSGTTCVAAIGLGRKCIGIDASEEYCGIARRRLAGLPNTMEIAAQ